MAPRNPLRSRFESRATHVLDTSAILALFLGEKGSEIVRSAGPSGTVSAVNASEVYAKMLDRGASVELVDEQLAALSIPVVAFDGKRARDAGALRIATKDNDISFADRACLALGLETGLPIVTGDRAWAKLDLPIDIRLIR